MIHISIVNKCSHIYMISYILCKFGPSTHQRSQHISHPTDEPGSPDSASHVQTFSFVPPPKRPRIIDDHLQGMRKSLGFCKHSNPPYLNLRRPVLSCFLESHGWNLLTHQSQRKRLFFGLFLTFAILRILPEYPIFLNRMVVEARCLFVS